MNYETIRKTIYDLLVDVEGIGKVFQHERYSADWTAFLDRYKTPHPSDETSYVVNVAFISRRGTEETAFGPYGSRDEREMITAVGVNETWVITLIYGYSDDEDTDASSEHTFQLLVDKVKEKFRTIDALGIPDVVQKSEPLKATGIGLATYGDVLCHRTELLLQVTQYHTW